MKESSRNPVVRGAAAHTDLNIFAAVKAVLESGALYTAGGDRAAARIIKICNDEMQRQLVAYDRAVEAGRQ